MRAISDFPVHLKINSDNIRQQLYSSDHIFFFFLVWFKLWYADIMKEYWSVLVILYKHIYENLILNVIACMKSLLNARSEHPLRKVGQWHCGKSLIFCFPMNQEVHSSTVYNICQGIF